MCIYCISKTRKKGGRFITYGSILYNINDILLPIRGLQAEGDHNYLKRGDPLHFLALNKRGRWA